MALVAVEVSNQQTPFIDGSVVTTLLGATSAAVTFTSGNVVTTAANALLLTGVIDQTNQVWAAGGSGTLIVTFVSQDADSAMRQAVTPAGTYNPIMTAPASAGNTAAMIVLAIKGVASAVADQPVVQTWEFDDDADSGEYSAHDDFTAANRVDVIQPDIIPVPFWIDDEIEEDEWAAAQLNPPPADIIQPDIIPTPFWIDDESEEDEWAALQLTPTPADVIQPDIIPVPLWDFDESEDEEWAALQLNPTPADVISASASLGAFSKFIDGGGTSVPVVTTPAVTTQSTGSSFVIMTLEVPTNIATITDNKGNTYTLTITSAVYSGSFTVNVYVCLNGAGGSGHSGILTKSSGNAVSEVSVFFTEIKNTIAFAGTAVAGQALSPSPITSPNLTTTSASAFLLSLFGGDGFGVNYAMAAAGYTPIDIEPAVGGVTAQGATAYKIAGGTGTYNAAWTSSPDQGGGVTLLAFASSAAIVADQPAIEFWNYFDESEDEEWATLQVSITQADVFATDATPLADWLYDDEEPEEPSFFDVAIIGPNADLITNPDWLDDNEPDDDLAPYQYTYTFDDVSTDIIPAQLWTDDELEEDEWSALQGSITPADVFDIIQQQDIDWEYDDDARDVWPITQSGGIPDDVIPDIIQQQDLDWGYDDDARDIWLLVQSSTIPDDVFDIIQQQDIDWEYDDDARDVWPLTHSSGIPDDVIDPIPGQEFDWEYDDDARDIWPLVQGGGIPDDLIPDIIQQQDIDWEYDDDARDVWPLSQSSGIPDDLIADAIFNQEVDWEYDDDARDIWPLSQSGGIPDDLVPDIIQQQDIDWEYEDDARDIWPLVQSGSIPADIISHASTGLLAGQGASIAGASTRFRQFLSTGNLIGQGASVAGTASRLHIFTSTGVLVGQGGTVAGSAARIAIHLSTGTLVSQGSTIVGASTRFRTFAATGTLIGQGTASGTAQRFRVFTSTGVLIGQGATVNGVALHSVLHTSAGALVGQGSTIAGVSNRFISHNAVGLLIGLGSTIAGSAALVKTHLATGALVGSGSAVNGTAQIGTAPNNGNINYHRRYFRESRR